MLSKWPIRDKLLLGIGLLLVIVGTLAASGSYGLYSYRGLVRTLRDRSRELPLATQLGRQVGDLRSTLSELRGRHDDLGTGSLQEFEPDAADAWDGPLFREEFRRNLAAYQDTLAAYRAQLDSNLRHIERGIGDGREERETLAKIERTLTQIGELNEDQDWLLREVRDGELTKGVERLRELTDELPSHLHRRFFALAHDVRLQYRTAIVLTWATSVAALLMFALCLRLFYHWIFQPLRTLIEGSRQVATGSFQHRIHLESQDEMSELAEAMNAMTSRFQVTRDDLDRQVQERTKQVVRSEQLASVGFLAAGVAHEINNPLASIALCAESLESRLADLLTQPGEDHAIARNYLRMIQDEAFRCKSITEKLLDFSRMGDIRRQDTDLRELVESVIDMVRHLGRFHDKRIELVDGQAVVARVNPQEIKQVVLNLLTNALDSLDQGGTVTVDVKRRGGQAELAVIDDGCGMAPDVLQHVFEPFFTRRRSGQGTGLGLSITYRIVIDHGGQIDAVSDGSGKGSKFIVTLPLDHAITIEPTHSHAA
jgi:signal transduction histidine kinase